MAVRRRPVAASNEEVHSETETETPRKFHKNSDSSANAGWGSSGGSNSAREEKRTVVSAPYHRVGREKKFLKFLDEAPTVRYERHYINGRYQTCPASIGELPKNDKGEVVQCPLCENGNKPSQAFMMNIVDMTEGPENDGTWTVKTWTFGTEVRNQLVSFLEEEKYQPLTQPKWYWQVFQVTGENQRKSTKILPVKDRDLQDDDGIEPLTEEEFEDAAARTYGAETVFIPYISTLAKLV